MLPFRTRALFRLHLSDGAIRGCQIDRCVHNKLVRTIKIDVLPDGLAAALDTLFIWMSELSSSVEIEWVLGTPWSRYVLMPWDSKLADSAFRNKLAGALFEKQFAEDAKQFDLVVAQPRYEQPCLVVCTEKTVLRQLTAFVDRQPKGRLRFCFSKVYSELELVWNYVEPELRKLSGEVLLLSRDRCLRVEHVDGAIVTLGSLPFSGDLNLPSSVDVSALRVIGLGQSSVLKLAPANFLKMKLPTSLEKEYAVACCGITI